MISSENAIPTLLPGEAYPITHRQPASGAIFDPVIAKGARFQGYFSLLRDFGSQLHFSGEGGDAILSPPLNFLADLARMGDGQRLREFAQARARLTSTSPELIL